MKIKYSPEIIKQLRQIDKLMDLRISQLKTIEPEHWWELSLRDEMYSFLCKKYTEIKCMETNPRIEITQEEKKNLLAGLSQLNDKVTPEKFLEELKK